MTDELVPIRCVTCGKVIGNKWEAYQQMLEEGVSIEQALNRLGLVRPCCRLRLRNPFKVVDLKPQTQEEIDRSLESDFDRLTVSSSVVKNTNMMVIPEDDNEIELAPIPVVSIPTKQGVVRRYQAW